MSTATDAQGRYEFTALRPGRYTLEASKSAYITLQYGQRRPFEAGKPIELAEGAALEKVDIALPRGGVISGTVLDDLGEPVALGCVMALRSRFDEGKRKLVPMGQWVGTNDLGQYRLFGLQPGIYFVRTCRAPRVPLDDVPFAPAYYPGTFNPAEAEPVAVRLGEEHGGVVLVQPAARLARLSGIVLDSAGRPFPGAAVQILSTSNDGSAIQARVKADGSFSVDDIIPGEYRVAAVQRGPGPRDVRRTDYPITVTADGQAGLVLQLLEGCRVRGRVVTEEGTAPSFRPSGMRVSPIPVMSDLPFTKSESDAQTIVREDWTFEMNGIAGSVVFTTPALPAGYMLKSVFLNGRDITDRPVDIKGTDEVAGLEVVITARVTEVAGAAPVDALGHPAVNYGVVVFADDAALWRYPSRLLAAARPDQQGRFKITNLPPGRYLAVALEYVEEGQEQDREYLESLRSIATPFTLSWGEAKTLDLKLTKSAGT